MSSCEKLSSKDSACFSKTHRTNIGGLIILKKLNQAKFDVFLAHSSVHNSYVALKIFPFIKGQINPFFENEIHFSNLNHSNVICAAHHETEKEILVRRTPVKISYIVMELAPYGDFFELIVTNKICFDEKLARTYFRQLIHGLEYLHSKGIAHLDIKLENLLCGQDFQLKIADFDHSVIDGKAEFPVKGTVFYRAPEVIKGICNNYEAADIYSAGIVLFLFNCGGMLPHLENNKFEGIDLLDLLNNNNKLFWVKHCEIQNQPSSFFSEDFKSLFNTMTKADPNERISIKDIKTSSWFNGPIYTDKALTSLMTDKLSCLIE